MDLNALAEHAALLLVERHRPKLLQGEVIRVFITSYKGLRRICLELEDPGFDQCLDLFVDLPEIPGQEDEAKIALGLDFLDGVLAEHLESNREALPRLSPVAHEFEGQTVHLSGGMRRPSLEAEANSLLTQTDEEKKFSEDSSD